MNETGEVRLAVTGGTGFIARGVLEICSQAGLPCRAISRSTRPAWAGQAIEWVTVSSYEDETGLRQGLEGAKYLLHLADNPARNDAHSTKETTRICDAIIDAVKSSHVEGVIVASSIYAALDQGDEASSYGANKRIIEEKFLATADIATIILRLPPVYGPGSRGGFSSLWKLVSKGLPLPLGMAIAPRSYLSRHNLASLIVSIVTAGNDTWRNASNRIFEPSDGVAVSTRELVRMMGDALGRDARLLPVPLVMLRMVAALTGKKALLSGAIDPLDVAPVAELEVAFGWSPVEHMPESLSFLRDEVSSS